MVTIISVEVFPGVLQTEQKCIERWKEAIVESAIFGGIDFSSNVQEQIPSAFRSGECEKYENDRGSSLLSAKMRKTSESVRKILRVTVQNVLRSSRENQRGIRIDTGKEVHGTRQWELQ